MACEPHLLKFPDHIAYLCDRNTRQTDKHLVHRHLNNRLIELRLRCHNGDFFDSAALSVRIIDDRRRNIIIPLLALDKIPQKLLRHAVERDHKHLLGTRALAIIFPHRLLKDHMQHIRYSDIQNCKKHINGARERIGLLCEIQHQHQPHDNNDCISHCIVKFLIVTSRKKISVGIEKHIVEQAQNNNVCPYHEMKLFGIIFVVNDVESNKQCQSIGHYSAQNVDEQDAVSLYHFVFPSDVLHVTPSNPLPILCIISCSTIFVKNPGCMLPDNF